MSQHSNVAFIFARGGSKGLPGKNIMPLGGIPLIGRAIQSAQEVDEIDRIIVSTDDDDIMATALEYGAEVPFRRPEELATDNAPEWLSWQHAIKWAQANGGIETFISLPATSPLRNGQDIKACLDAYDPQDTDMVVTVRQAARSPYFNMVSKTKTGHVELSAKAENKYSRRQDVPEVFDMTTVAYIGNPAFILKENSIFSGQIKAVEIPRGRAVDIDDLYDLAEAEAFLEKGLITGDPKKV